MKAKSIIIAKFGGTSVSSLDNIKTIEAIILRETKDHAVVVVVSALSKVTDLFFSAALGQKSEIKEKLTQIRKKHEDLIREMWGKKSQQASALSYIDKKLHEALLILEKEDRSKKALDTLVSFGEIMSSFLVSAWFSWKGISSSQVIASDIIETDDNFGSAEIFFAKTKKKAKKILGPLLAKGITPVVTGFIGATRNGEITTFGRGGSDYTASILGFSLSASEVQIWTDVNGIFTADPRFVKRAKPISEISYQEASEMAFLGAKVLHPRTIRPAVKAGIPVRVLNIFNPSYKGTTITYKKGSTGRIIAVSFKKKVVLVTIKAEEMFLAKGFLSKIFYIFSKQNISIDLVSVSEVSVSLTLDHTENLDEVISKIQMFARVAVDNKASVVSVIGEHIGRSPHAIRDIFLILDEKKIRVKMISFSAQNRNISLVIDKARCEEAVQTLHDRLLLRRKI